MSVLLVPGRLPDRRCSARKLIASRITTTHIDEHHARPIVNRERFRVRPAFVPRATRRRQEEVGWAGASNSQVNDEIRLLPQVARSAPRTLSRWRHGFEPRWDYQETRR